MFVPVIARQGTALRSARRLQYRDRRTQLTVDKAQIGNSGRAELKFDHDARTVHVSGSVVGHTLALSDLGPAIGADPKAVVKAQTALNLASNRGARCA